MYFEKIKEQRKTAVQSFFFFARYKKNQNNLPLSERRHVIQKTAYNK